jgi:hypothetical protein
MQHSRTECIRQRVSKPVIYRQFRQSGWNFAADGLLAGQIDALQYRQAPSNDKCREQNWNMTRADAICG